MVLIPKASITYNLTTREDFIPYPGINSNITSEVDSFLIDKYPVTNAQFHDFILKSGYSPVDTANYLKHWISGIFKQGQENYPVMYVSYEDMPNGLVSDYQLRRNGSSPHRVPTNVNGHGVRSFMQQDAIMDLTDLLLLTLFLKVRVRMVFWIW
jgi:formylglycine-generating enzyme required for sulfatase activity